LAIAEHHIGAAPKRPGARAVRSARTGRLAPGADDLLRLQRTAGNRAVGHRLRTVAPVQRSWLSDAADLAGDAASAVGRGAAWLGDRVGDAFDARENEAVLDYREDRDELKAFRREGVRGPQNLRAPTGIGGFGAAYDPQMQQLLIRLAGGVEFTDSIRFAGEIAVVSHPKPVPALTQFVAQVNRLPPAQRRDAAAPYLWTAGERSAFLSTFNDGVRSRWSGRFDFHAIRRYWTDLAASVDVSSAIHAGAKLEDEHLSVTVYKTPPGGAGNVGVVQSGTGPTDNRMQLNSPDVSPRADNLLHWSGTFPAGTPNLDADGRAELNRVGATFRGGGPGCSICGVTILASSGGPTLTVRVSGQTEAAARARYQDMLNALASGGNLDITLRAEFRYGGAGDGYEIEAGNGVAQSVAEHEAGHMFGLGDEYATGEGSMISGTGAAAGGETSHDGLAKDMGLNGAVFENNDGIMSLGTIVKPQHYVTFHWALTELTGIDWAIGPAVPVIPPPGAEVGDFPTPDRTTAMA